MGRSKWKLENITIHYFLNLQYNKEDISFIEMCFFSGNFLVKMFRYFHTFKDTDFSFGGTLFKKLFRLTNTLWNSNHN